MGLFVRVNVVVEEGVFEGVLVKLGVLVFVKVEVGVKVKVGVLPPLEQLGVGVS